MELLKIFGFNKARDKAKEEESGDVALSKIFSLPSPIPQWPQG
jgi:hypothetical protein